MLKPLNRYILIDLPQSPEQETDSLIVLPEEYKPKEEERYVQVRAVCAAPDARFNLSEGVNLVVDRSMIEEISIGATIYNVILDNYVVGMIE
tara:strand:+ start:19021 stop:19296 length:276 start_codon:yes stop_codon:yes gene_type:complete